MSNTFYIDANVKNSINVNSTNNRFTYKLPNAIELPCNTEIALQSSIINLKGITGASIELNDDYEDTVIYQYYAIDSSYPAPNREATFSTNANVAYMLNSETCTHNNVGVGEFAGLNFPAVDRFDDAPAGWSEFMMPLVGEVYNGTNVEANRTAVPMLGKSKIKITKGIYSINQLAEIITDQINVASLVDRPESSITANRNKGWYEFQRNTATLGFTGYAANNSTLRSFRVEDSEFWDDPVGILGNLTRNNQDYIGATDFTQFNQDNRADGFCSVIAVSANTNQNLIQNAQFNGFTSTSRTAGCSFKDLTNPLGADKQYYMGWQKRNGFAQVGGQRNYNFVSGTYDIFTLGQGFGTAQFKIEYDTDESAYTINYTHQPRKIPTVDRYGTKLDNAGQECVYIKKPCNDIDNDGSISAGVKGSLTAAVQKLGGIAITNWGFETCLREGDNISSFAYADTPTEARKNQCMQYRHYDDFFTTKDKARAAWDTTIWSRMGFQYDDIQNSGIDGAGVQDYFQYGVGQAFRGFITNQEVDNTIQPTISTIFNPTVAATGAAGTPPKPAAPAKGQTRGALPAVADVQRFMLFSQNIPDKVFTNDSTAGATIITAPYKASFYKGAVMIPVLTQGKPFVASKLPILSENGYILITSDIVEGNDILKNQQTDGILDLIPKSSLSNQDYMADRNVITHTLSNPKSINEINIKILNPDMTDITLSPNSTFLLRITLPMPKPTNFIFDEELQAKEQQVGQVVQHMVASHTDPNKAQNNIRLDISNTAAVDTGGLGIEPIDPVAAAAQGIVAQAIADDLRGIPPLLPQGGLNPDALDYPALQDDIGLDEVAAAQAAAQQQQQGARDAPDQQAREQAAAGAGRPRGLRLVRRPAPAGEEPAGSTDVGVMRKSETRSAVQIETKALRESNRQLQELRQRRADQQGRAVARGRNPREQVAINADIARTEARIEELVRIIRGFGGTPDPEVRRIRVRERRPLRPTPSAREGDRPLADPAAGRARARGAEQQRPRGGGDVAEQVLREDDL